jgi:tRNA pseudouridine synthase 10
MKRNFPTLKYNRKITNLKCFICKGIFSIINEIAHKIFDTINFQEKYSYRSFTIGTSLPYYMFDKEDYIRSLFKLKDIEDIKTSFNFEIRNKFKFLSKKKLNLKNPDIKINLFISDNNEYSITILSRSLFLLGRYTKKKFMTQREKNVLTSYPIDDHDQKILKKQSIEAMIQKTLSNYIKFDRIVFTWYGSEDDNSQVLGKGRLFLIQLINPRNRTIKINKVFTNNGISFKIIEKSDFIENVKRNFRIKNKIFIKASNPINQIHLSKLMKLNNSIIRYCYKSKLIYKKIYYIRFKKLDPFHLIINIECDSGLFLRQFIEGRNFIEPNISSVLSNQCECLKFDIMNISIS